MNREGDFNKVIENIHHETLPSHSRSLRAAAYYIQGLQRLFQSRYNEEKCFHFLKCEQILLISISRRYLKETLKMILKCFFFKSFHFFFVILLVYGKIHSCCSLTFHLNMCWVGIVKGLWIEKWQTNDNAWILNNLMWLNELYFSSGWGRNGFNCLSL